MEAISWLWTPNSVAVYPSDILNARFELVLAGRSVEGNIRTLFTKEYDKIYRINRDGRIGFVPATLILQEPYQFIPENKVIHITQNFTVTFDVMQLIHEDYRILSGSFFLPAIPKPMYIEFDAGFDVYTAKSAQDVLGIEKIIQDLNIEHSDVRVENLRYVYNWSKWDDLMKTKFKIGIFQVYPERKF